MHNIHHQGLDLLMQVDGLLAAEQENILGRERHNTNKIYLYRLGDCWAAFNKSAFLMEQTSMTSDLPEVFELHGTPFQLVMHIIDDQQVRIICRNKYSKIRNSQHIQLSSIPIDTTAYNSWYNDAVY